MNERVDTPIPHMHPKSNLGQAHVRDMVGESQVPTQNSRTKRGVSQGTPSANKLEMQKLYDLFGPHNIPSPQAKHCGYPLAHCEPYSPSGRIEAPYCCMLPKTRRPGVAKRLIHG